MIYAPDKTGGFICCKTGFNGSNVRNEVNWVIAKAVEVSEPAMSRLFSLCLITLVALRKVRR